MANGSTTEFVYNANGRRVSVWNGNTQIQGQYYWGSKPVAFYKNGQIHFQHQNWLGTERLRTSYNGSTEGSYISLPFGDGQSSSGSDLDPYHFAMLDYDTETATDHAQFRQHNSTQGRWMSPDPYSGSYDFSNPQSFNRYAYALNNPLSLVDPLGLDSCSQAVSASGAKTMDDSNCQGSGNCDDLESNCDGGDDDGSGQQTSANCTDENCQSTITVEVDSGPDADPQTQSLMMLIWLAYGPIPTSGTFLIPSGGSLGGSGNAPNNLAGTRPLFGPSTMVSSCRRVTYYPIGTTCDFVCENVDDYEPTTSNFTAQISVLEKACGSANMPTGMACPSLVTVESKSFFIGPIGISFSNKILSCVP